MAFQPFLHPTGPGNASPVDVFLLLSMLATIVWAAGAHVRIRAPYVVAVTLIVLGGALAGVTGPLPGTALLAVFQDLVIFAWAVAITNLASREGVLRTLTTAWAVTSVCWASVLVTASVFGLTSIEGIVAREGNRALFTFGDPNYAGTYWITSIFLVYATQRPRRRWLRWLGYGLLVWSLILTESNGSVFALLVGVLFVLVVATYRRFGAPAAVAVPLVTVALVGGLLTAMPLAQMQTWARDSGQPVLVNSIGRSNGSSAQRSELIAESMQLYARYGVLGSGPGSTKPLLQEGHYPYAKEAHDDYLAALVERGPIGLAGVLLLVTGAAVRAARVLRTAPRGWPELPRPVGLVAGLLAMAVAGVYYEVLHFRYTWLLLAFIAAVAAVRPGRRTGSADRPATGVSR
ncbi:O-antigen ligase family protein [Pseudonocardia halophobica]|uniref:O-antigen ligase family protein n=1 Tax=Pseudonocardia halophobica TaxID=29401 RepID=UPI003D92A5FB